MRISGRLRAEIRVRSKLIGFLQIASLNFDASVWQLLLPLGSGRLVCLRDRAARPTRPYLAGLIRGKPGHVAHFVPSLLEVFLEHEELGDFRQSPASAGRWRGRCRAAGGARFAAGCRDAGAGSASTGRRRPR